MFTRNLAVELGPLGITISNIDAGRHRQTAINTNLLNNSQQMKSLLGADPARAVGQPTDVAGLAVFLASSESDYVTGSTYFIDGGLIVHYEEQ